MPTAKEEFERLRTILPDYREGDTPFNTLRFKYTGFSALDVKGHKSNGASIPGVFSVFGNRDSYGDRVMPGSMVKTMSEGRRRIRHLWNHIGWDPPIAKIDDLFEIGKSDLPQAVLDAAPDALGAGVVVRSYFDFARATEVRTGVMAGAINEMSFAFDITKSDMATETINGSTDETRFIRELVLFDTSDVNWGANDATVAQRSMPHGMLSTSLKCFLIEVKAGLRTSPADLAMYKDLCGIMAKLDGVTPLLTGAPTASELPPAEPPASSQWQQHADNLVSRLRLLALEC